MAEATVPELDLLIDAFGGGSTATEDTVTGSKAVKNAPDKAIELYDLKPDTAEQKNVASQHPGLVDKAAALPSAAHVEIPEWPMVQNQKQRTEARRKSGLIK